MEKITLSNGRLDTWKRSAIVEGALTHAFAERRNLINIRENLLGVECYNQIFSQKIRDQIKLIPEGWIQTVRNIRLNVAGLTVEFNINPSLPVPWNTNFNRLGIIQYGELSERVLKFLSEKEQLKKEENDLRNNLRGLLNSVNTINQLKAIWPEGEQFYSCYAIKKASKQHLPAIQFDKINAALRIPLVA